jgi:hypothetical protein
MDKTLRESKKIKRLEKKKGMTCYAVQEVQQYKNKKQI